MRTKLSSLAALNPKIQHTRPSNRQISQQFSQFFLVLLQGSCCPRRVHAGPPTRAFCPPPLLAPKYTRAYLTLYQARQPRPPEGGALELKPGPTTSMQVMNKGQLMVAILLSWFSIWSRAHKTFMRLLASAFNCVGCRRKLLICTAPSWCSPQLRHYLGVPTMYSVLPTPRPLQSF